MVFNPHFYLLRLRQASLPEVACRIKQGVALLQLKILARAGEHFVKVPEIEANDIQDLAMPELNLEVNNPLCTGTIAEPFSPWAPFTVGKGHNDPRLANGNPAESDIRMVWEPARLQQAVLLLVYADQNANFPGRDKARKAAKTIIFSWLMTNPFPLGIHYTSAMECALRIPVFFSALKKINDLDTDEYIYLLEAIYRHAWLVSRRLSLYSSSGNHTIAEAVGLVFAGAIYQRVSEGREWLETGIRLLTKELTHQILNDGGPAEQSLAYHRFVLDLYWLVMDFILKNNIGDVHHWERRLAAGESFLNAFQDEQGAFPPIGDSDSGFAIAPGVRPARGAGKTLIKGRTTFEHSGFSVLRGGELVFTFNHGPLGMPPLYNHGHADALSITLSKNGHPLLVDPGTYRYNGLPEWRRYFKGTRAHNTVTIDDQDQAIQETSFIWSKPYTAMGANRLEENGQISCTAAHNGYMRLKNPVRHQRTVLFFDKANFLIRDRFIGAGFHCFQLNFHLHPNAVASKEGKWWIVDNGGGRAFVRLLEGDFQMVRGQTNPVMGWFSRRYGKKEPTGTLTVTRTGNADAVVFTTAIYTRSPLESVSMEPKRSGSNVKRLGIADLTASAAAESVVNR